MVHEAALLELPQLLAHLFIVVYVYYELIVVCSIQAIVESLVLDLLPRLVHD